jgi:hypothetical protein
MSYLPIPRCIAIPCTNNASDLSYFIVLEVSQLDYSYFQEFSLAPDCFRPIALADGVLEYDYCENYVFTDPGSGGTYDLLLPCSPTNGPAANTFIMNYYNSEVNIYPEGSITQCPITTTGGTINPPTQRPTRDLGDAIGNALPFILQSVNDPANQGLGVVLNIPANINPRLNPGTPDPDPTKLSLVADTAANSDAYDIAIYNVQPIGVYTSVYVTFPDGSVTDPVSISGAQVFII